MSIKKKRLKVQDMTCTSCENRVEKAVKKLYGVSIVKASYSGQFAEVEYDSALCGTDQIKAAIKSAGYTPESSTKGSTDNKFIGILIVVAIVAFLGINASSFDMESMLSNASYAVLFIVGILTSIHCVGMCGGIMLSQSLSKESKSKFEAMEPAILYNLGRILSYTILGGIIGALGSVLSLSLSAKAALQIFAGIFMLIMGFNMAGFSAFRKLSIKLPSAACRIKNKPRTPFLVGFLNGLMPCGPLQTMQLFALGTGSPLKGALSMFIFAIGTVPLMLTFGAISGLLSKGYTKKLLKFSGVLIIVLGLIMGNRGLALAGVNINPLSLLKLDSSATSNSSTSSTGNKAATPSSNEGKAVLKDGVQVINMAVGSRGYSPNVLYIQKGIPVKWVIDGKQLNSCNNAIAIPSLNQQYDLQSGENIIEFTPGDKDFIFSCWMGMIRGKFKVVDDLGSINASSGTSSDTTSDASDPSKKPSIYGDDISKVPTSRLVVKSQISDNTQNIKIKGIGYELESLIVAAKKGINTKLSLDLTSFDNPEGAYSIVDANTGDLIKDFEGKKGIVGVEFTIRESGTYGIVKDGELIGLLEFVDNLEAVNLDELRKKYLR